MPDHECRQEGRITRDEVTMQKHIDESGAVRERLRAIEALGKAIDERVHEHKYDALTGWETRLQRHEFAISELGKILGPIAEWMKEATRKKEWWEQQVVGVALQIFTVALLIILGLKGV